VARADTYLAAPHQMPTARSASPTATMAVLVSRFALTDRAWFGESDRHLGVIGVGELGHVRVMGLVRPN